MQINFFTFPNSSSIANGLAIKSSAPIFFAIYCNEKVVALVCDDQLFLKPTKAGRELIENLEEAPLYPGAKNYFLISPDQWEDREYLTNLITATASELPLPKPKKKKN